MILFDISKARRLIWILFPALMLLVPLVSSAQDITSLKRLRRVSYLYYNNDAEPRTTHEKIQIYYYDSINPFQINSYLDYSGVTTADGICTYMEDTINFSGVTNYYPDYFTFTSPTLIQTNLRTCKLTNAGYLLEDNYAHPFSPQNYRIVNKYIYNANMKLTAKMRSDYYSHKHWKTECVLDSLDRRITEINYTSVDSINWSPTRKLEYFYSDEQITHPYQFEKYNLYAPDNAYYNHSANWELFDYNNVASSPLYLCDSWVIDHMDYYSYTNEDWLFQESCEVVNTQTASTWSASSTHGYANTCTWDNYGMPIKICGGDTLRHEYSFSYSSPTALVDCYEAVPATFSVSAYPNPNLGNTQLTIKTDKPELITVCTYNLRGQKLKAELVHANPSGTASLSWQATDNAGKPLPNGIYLLKFIGSSHKQVKRITVAR